MKEIKVTPIKDGTVIDHIPAGCALKVLSIIGMTKNVKNTVSVVMNVSSKKTRKKDVVKVENKALTPKEVNKIALVAPSATINIIRNYNVVKKFKVKLPKVVKGIVKCENPSCISNSNEPVEPEFTVVQKVPPVLRCLYCEREMEHPEKHIIES